LHPILLHLPPWACSIVGALVVLMIASSQWDLLVKSAGAQGAKLLAVVLMGVGAFAGFRIGQGFAEEPAIHTFGPLVALGSFMAIVYIRREGARRGFDPEVLTGLAVEVLLVGVAGSRVLFIAITQEAFPHIWPPGTPYWQYLLNSYVIQYLALWNGGLVWYGGLLPAAIWALWRGKKLGLPWRTIGDIFAPSVMLGLAIGRVGCLMAGDDHGKAVPDGLEHWWTVTFHDEGALLSDKRLLHKPLYPTQPMMTIGDLIIFGVCHAFRKRLANRPGAVMYLMLTLYPILRFIIELYRGDTVRKFVYWWAEDPVTHVPTEGISTSMAISIPLWIMMIGLFTWVLLRPPRGVESPGEHASLKTEPNPDAPVAAATELAAAHAAAPTSDASAAAVSPTTPDAAPRAPETPPS
jgi:phosphatidylglycerol:prolipoprotein diacylglycerol transferase